MPQFIVRQTLIIGFTAGAVVIGMNPGATAAMIASAAAVWIAMIGQLIVLNRRLGASVAPGPKTYDLRVVESLVADHDGLRLLPAIVAYRRAGAAAVQPSEEVGVYFAVVKTLALVSFIHYAILATTAHRFSGIPRLRRQAAVRGLHCSCHQMDLLAFGRGNRCAAGARRTLLWLFGPQFTAGYGIMFVAAIGLIVRSAIGPAERLLNMLGHQNMCALAYALAFLVNLVLCILLVPRFGGYGAAAATSIALVFETILLFWITRSRLGFHVLAGKKAKASPHHVIPTRSWRGPGISKSSSETTAGSWAACYAHAPE